MLKWRGILATWTTGKNTKLWNLCFCMQKPKYVNISVKCSVVLVPMASRFPLAVVAVLGVETQGLSLNRKIEFWIYMWHGYSDYVNRVNVSRSSSHASVMIFPPRNLHKHSLRAIAEYMLRRDESWTSVKPPLHLLLFWMIPTLLTFNAFGFALSPIWNLSFPIWPLWSNRVLSMRTSKFFMCTMSPPQTMDYVLLYVLHIIYKR